MIYSLFLTQAMACIPCDKEAGIIVVRQVSPVFATGFSSDETEANVVFNLSISAQGEVEAFSISHIQPENIPLDVIGDMIIKSTYRSVSHSRESGNCGVENQEMTFTFAIPQKLMLKPELEMGLAID